MTESPGDISSIEVRRPPRARTFLQARASYSDGAISTDCTVNQLSDAGARLSITSSFALPEIFEIAIPQRGISRRVKLIWRKDDLVGLELLARRGLDPATDRNLKFLRRIWMEKLPRAAGETID